MGKADHKPTFLWVLAPIRGDFEDGYGWFIIAVYHITPIDNLPPRKRATMSYSIELLQAVLIL